VDIERTCDWVVMLDGGKVLRSQPLSGLVETETVEVDVLGDVLAVGTALLARGADVTTDGTLLAVQYAHGDPFDLILDVLTEVGAGMRSLGTRSTSLEDLFLAGTDGGAP
jgi:ABC-2 type transport system ATP-binding protein